MFAPDHSCYATGNNKKLFILWGDTGTLLHQPQNLGGEAKMSSLQIESEWSTVGMH